MIKNILIFTLIPALLLTACQNTQDHNRKQGDENQVNTASKVEDLKRSDIFYQYSIWFAFVNKVFDGTLKVSEMKARGDIGLGSFDFLDGELVMLDGIPYRIREDGEISVAEDQDEVVYCNATFFDTDGSFMLEGDLDFERFKTGLDGEMKTPHYFYAYVAHGEFDYVKLGGVPKVERPFTEGLDILIPNRPVFETENISGTLVGFYCPDFIGDINARGHHFHFISDDRQWGGHMMEFKVSEGLEIAFDEITGYAFDLPASEDFEKVTLDKIFQYN